MNSYAAERSSSALIIIDASIDLCVQQYMTAQRLDNCFLCRVHKNVLDDLSIREQFVNVVHLREQYFGRFT